MWLIYPQPFLMIGMSTISVFVSQQNLGHPDLAAILICHGTAGSIITIGFITKWMFALEKPVWREKTRLTSPEVRAVTASKSWRDSGRASFSLLRKEKDKRRLCSQGESGTVWKQQNTWSSGFSWRILTKTRLKIQVVAIFKGNYNQFHEHGHYLI